MNLKKFQKKYLFYLSIITYIVIAGFSVLLASFKDKEKKVSFIDPVVNIPKFSFYKRPDSLPANPVLKEGSVGFPIVSARAVLAIDLDSMVPLFEKNPDVPFLPASTTKIVTALVAMDHYKDSDVLEVVGPKVSGQSMGLVQGEKLQAGSLLEGLLIYSANDAAETLARNYPGGREVFIDAMNKKASELHLGNTHFENPVGFDSAENFSTARDLVRVTIEAMKISRFSSIVNQKEKYVASVDGNIIHKLTSTNKLLGLVPGVLGVKTGWTENARENLITYMERDGHKVLIALMGSQDRFGETKEIINWLYSNYVWGTVKPS